MPSEAYLVEAHVSWSAKARGGRAKKNAEKRHMKPRAQDHNGEERHTRVGEKLDQSSFHTGATNS